MKIEDVVKMDAFNEFAERIDKIEKARAAVKIAFASFATRATLNGRLIVLEHAAKDELEEKLDGRLT